MSKSRRTEKMTRGRQLDSMTYRDFADNNVRGRPAESSCGLCHGMDDSVVELLCRAEVEAEAWVKYDGSSSCLGDRHV